MSKRDIKLFKKLVERYGEPYAQDLITNIGRFEGKDYQIWLRTLQFN